MTLIERFESPGPKRILALDGGGIRGALTLGYLEKIEEFLQVQHGHDNEFRLCDYFDLIGGTSTGSIIASCLEIGKMEDDLLTCDINGKGLISYLRYNLWLEKANLDDLMEKTYTQKQIKSLTEMSNAKNRQELYKIGLKAASKDVGKSHFHEKFIISKK